MNFDQWIDEHQAELIETTRALMAFNSIEEAPYGNMPFGKSVGECLDKALEICRNMGFETKKRGLLRRTR